MYVPCKGVNMEGFLRAKYFCTCVICVGCEVPGKPTNGQHYFRNINVGRTVTYGCDDGLELVGDQSRDCLETGRWSGSVPVCKCMHIHS